MPKYWRLIPPINASGEMQMAIDHWLLEKHRQGLHPPVLRFYTWSTPAISLGYHQQRWPEFWHNLSWQGVPVELVRRPSGGRAVLHQGDLTYAVITSGLAGKRLEAYQFICQFLIEGWRDLGVELRYGEAGKSYINSPNCFSTATGADLVLPTGAKLIGSAQLRRDGAILQHGSIKLQPNRELFEQVFGESEEIELPLTIQGEELIQSVIKALTAAAQRCFGIEFVTQPLTDTEKQECLAFQIQNPSIARNTNRINS